jgi:hypothetical protein
MDDTIYRQAAIDAARKCNVKEVTPSYMLIDKAEAMTELMMLPSAQPEIIRCKDCKFWTHIERTNRYWCKTDDGLYDLNPSPDDFCSRAERRTDE